MAQLCVGWLLCLALAGILLPAAAQSFGPGTYDGCEDEKWVRVGGYCYYLAAKSAVQNAPARTQAAADGFCASLTLPRTIQMGNDSITVNFTDTARLASFASHSAWESFVNAAATPYGGNFGATFSFWIGCAFSAVSGMTTWTDGS